MKYYLAMSENGESHWQFDDTCTVEEVCAMIGDALRETVDGFQEISRNDFESREI